MTLLWWSVVWKSGRTINIWTTQARIHKRLSEGVSSKWMKDVKEIKAQTLWDATHAGGQPEAYDAWMGLEDVAPLIAKLLGIKLKQAEDIVYPGVLIQEKKK